MEIFETSPETNWNGSIASAPDSPARTFQTLDDAEELKALAAVFGLSVPVWWGDLDLDTCSLKTFQGSLFTTQYDELSETWPDSGMWAGGVVYELRNSEPVTSENEFSLWRTPHPRDHHAQGPRLEAKQRQIYLCDQATTWPTANTKDANSAARHTTTTGVMHPGTTLTDAIRMWPTATCGDTWNPSTNESAERETAKHNLRGACLTWPTPRQEDGESCGNHPNAMDSLTGVTRMWPTAVGTASGGRTKNTSNYDPQGNKRQIQLEAVAPLWTTPQAHQGGANSKPEDRGSGGPDLKEQSEHWFPTPASRRDYRTPNRRSFQERTGTKKGEQLQNFVEHSRQVPRIPDGPASSPKGQTSRRRLNPQFVEWLMGFPIGWTEL